VATLIRQVSGRVRTQGHALVWSVQRWWTALPHRPVWWGLLLGLGLWALWAAGAWSAASSSEATQSRAGVAHVDAAALQALLVPASRASNVMQDLFDLAQNQGVEVLGSAYSTQPEPQAGLVRLVVNMPLKGSAIAVRHFIESALRAHAALAIQRLQIRRESGRDSLVEAQVEWVLLTQAAGPERMEAQP
jgi:4-amino-4-deoxy-L-arabinose transferase-like glycosyltransferase